MKLHITTGIIAMLALATAVDLAHAQNGNYSSSYSRSYSSSSSWGTGQTPVYRSYQSTSSTTMPPGARSFQSTGSMAMPQAARSFQSSSSLSRISLQNAPILSALKTVEQAGVRKIFVSDAAKKLLLTSARVITIAGSYGSQTQLLSKVLEGVDVQVVTYRDVLLLQVPAETEPLKNSKQIGSLVVEEALGRKMPLHFENAPLPMVLGMLEGSTGIRISRMTSNQMWSMSDPLISVRSEEGTVREILEAIAAQIGCEVRIGEDCIAFVRKVR